MSPDTLLGEPYLPFALEGMMSNEHLSPTQGKPRVSRSKSGISKDDRWFVLVYKYPDGRCTKPIHIAREDAIKIALDYEQYGTGNRERKVSSAAASLMLQRAKRRGWLPGKPDPEDPTSTDTLSELNSGTVTDVPNKRTEVPGKKESIDGKGGSATDSQKPRFLPDLYAYITAELAPESVADVAYVLSGVDPAQRSNSSTPLQQIAVQPTGDKISRGGFMRQDHRYVLIHHSHLNESEFDQLWNEAKNPATGQNATDLLKLCRAIDKMNLGEDGSLLRNTEMKEQIQAIRDLAPAILFRVHKTVVRKIEEIHLSTSVVTGRKDAGITNRLTGWLMKGNQSADDSTQILPQVLEHAEEYLQQLVKMGRILRSEAARQEAK